MLLTRNILLRGIDSGDSFGCHSKIVGSSAVGKFSGVQAENCGQLNILGRYPFHFHMIGSGASATTSYFQDCSVTNSNFRSFVIHGTSSTRISRNVAFRVMGMSYYLEDGVEENNLFEYNIAVHSIPIYKPADGN